MGKKRSPASPPKTVPIDRPSPLTAKDVLELYAQLDDFEKKKVVAQPGSEIFVNAVAIFYEMFRIAIEKQHHIKRLLGILREVGRGHKYEFDHMDRIVEHFQLAIVATPKSADGIDRKTPIEFLKELIEGFKPKLEIKNEPRSKKDSEKAKRWYLMHHPIDGSKSKSYEEIARTETPPVKRATVQAKITRFATYITSMEAELEKLQERNDTDLAFFLFDNYTR